MAGDVTRSVNRRRAAAAFLGIAGVGHAHWFFGNLYEAVVRVPHKLASQRSTGSATSPFAPGSPLLYYVPALPATFPAALAALVFGWNNRESRSWLVGGAVCSLSGVAATAYLVRAVNLKLFFSAQSLTEEEQRALLRTWYRANVLRLVVSGGAWLAARQVRSRLS